MFSCVNFQNTNHAMQFRSTTTYGLNKQGNHLRASMLSHQFLHLCDRVHNCSLYRPRCPNTPCSDHGVLKCVCTTPLFTLLSNSDLKKKIKTVTKGWENCVFTDLTSVTFISQSTNLWRPPCFHAVHVTSFCVNFEKSDF